MVPGMPRWAWPVEGLPPRAWLSLVVAVVGAVAPAAAPAPALAVSSAVSASQKMLSGGGRSRNTSMTTIRIGDGRVAYLRFHVPSSWSGSDPLLSLDPSGASAGVSEQDRLPDLRVVRRRWSPQ